MFKKSNQDATVIVKCWFFGGAVFLNAVRLMGIFVQFYYKLVF